MSMRKFRSVSVMLIAAMVGAPAAPIVAGAPPAIKMHSPVRCNTSETDDYAQPRPYPMGGTVRAIPGPVAPPPAPPPPLLGNAPVSEIVVTGAKRPQTLQNSPVAVSAVSNDKLDRKAGRTRTESARIAPMPSPYPYPMPREDRERYTGKDVASIKAVTQEPVSTFSIDVDTGSYANVRRFLTQGQTPPEAAVRTEEMLNYFRYDYPTPADRSRPFSVTTDMATTPWNTDSRLLRIGIKGYDLPRSERPATNLVFLIDVSGSMMDQDKLPLVKTALSMLADRLTARDKVSIVVYAGAAGIVLDPTNNANYVKAALDCLQAGGSTAGGQGMELAYATARANFIKGGVNRVIMATDGDFNVGISSNEGIEGIVKKNRESGITLTTLGFGQGNYNEAMMEKVADIGNGNYAYIDTALEAQKVLDEEMAATLFTIAKDVKIQIEFNPALVREYRLIGYENRALNEEDFNNDKVDAGDIGAGHQVTALYEIVPAGGKGWLPDRRYEVNRTAARPSGPAGELAWLKLRYKLPDGDTSRLIEQPVGAGLMQAARAPSGDMAFACAVAAFGQKLRSDKYLGGFSYADIRRLAGDQRGYLREEFMKLTTLADARTPRVSDGG
jgi:Ca-activated chloride channel homolog